jgi:hypothetical protein
MLLLLLMHVLILAPAVALTTAYWCLDDDKIVSSL